MLNFISFIIVILGCINWLLIGLLQYDFVAGIFGYQGSVFSRLIYIIIGVASIILVIKAFSEKGKINLINFKFKFKKKNKKEETSHLQDDSYEIGSQSREEIKSEPTREYAHNNIEAGRDFHEIPHQQNQNNSSTQHENMTGRDYSENDFNQNSQEDFRERPPKNNIFDDFM